MMLRVKEYLEDGFAERMHARRLLRVLLEIRGPWHANLLLQCGGTRSFDESKPPSATLQSPRGNLVECHKLTAFAYRELASHPRLTEDVLHLMNVVQRVGNLRVVRRRRRGEHSAPHRCIGPGHVTSQLAEVTDREGRLLSHERSSLPNAAQSA